MCVCLCVEPRQLSLASPLVFSPLPLSFQTTFILSATLRLSFLPQVPDVDMDAVLKAFEEDQAKKQKMRDMLAKQGIKLSDQDEQQAKVLEQLHHMRQKKAQKKPKHQEL